MPKLNIAGDERVELHFEDYGQGAPVVLIHGWPLSGRAWEKQVPALVQNGFRVVTYDRRGFGDSSRPWNGYDYDTFAADLKALLEHLDLTEVTLVGFSMGGGEVARYIGHYGTKRVARAVFAAAVTPYLHKSTENPDGGADDATVNELEQGVKGDRLAFLEQFTHKFFSPAGGSCLVSEGARRYHRDIAAFASPKGTLDCIRAFSCTDFRDDLRKCDVPALVVHGDSDAIVPFEVSGKRVQALIDDCHVSVIKNGPHGINATHAAEFNQALLGFLR